MDTAMEERWDTLRNEARAYWSRLTDEDIEHIAGRAERLIDRLQLRYGYTRDRARLEAKYFIRERVSVLERRAERIKSGIQTQIRERPWALLMIGLLMGFFVGQAAFQEWRCRSRGLEPDQKKKNT